MQKIFEIKNEDWSKGISAQRYIPIGGLFGGLSGIDPFNSQGIAVPSYAPDTITPSSTPKFLLSFNSAGTDYMYWASGTEIKQTLKDSPYTQVDKTAQLTYSGAAMIGATIWRGKLIYAIQNNDIRSNTLPIAIGTDVQILGAYDALDTVTFEIGADGNLYFGGSNRVGVLTSATGTAGNSAGGFNIDTSFTVRALINNGRYLVILADNNTILSASRRVGNYKCRVYFWDMIKTTADIIYEIDDSYVIAGKQLDGNIYFFGYNGLYICNEASSPKMIRPFENYNGLTRAKPKNTYQLASSFGSLFWVDGFNNVLLNGVVNAYGNPTAGLAKIFYQPYVTGSSSNTQTVLQVVGSQIWMADDTPKIYVHNTGSAAGTGNIVTLNKVMDRPWKFDMVKVVLAAPLSSGQSVISSISTQTGVNTLSSSVTKSYNSANPKQTLIFKRDNTGQTNTKDRFEEFRLLVSMTGASIQRIAVYASPLEDTTEDL